MEKKKYNGIRKCCFCDKLFDKTISNFYNKSYCSKECYSDYMKKWRKDNNNYHRIWKNKHSDYMRIWWFNHKGYLKKWHLENEYFTEEYRIRRNVQALAFQNIKIPKGYKCELCEKELARERHHEDYFKPLEVILCCKKCHGILDEKRHLKEREQCQKIQI
jgi:hypothetical protein